MESKLTKQEKYFKRNIVHFAQQVLGVEEPDDELVRQLYKYAQYMRNNFYGETFDKTGVLELVKNYGDTMHQQSFLEGVDAMASHSKAAFLQLQEHCRSLENQLAIHKSKHVNVRNELLKRIKELEAVERPTPSELQHMEAAYKAGQLSVELVAYRGLNPEAQPYLTLKRRMNFRTWANQIWKYNKGIRLMLTKLSHNRKINWEAPYDEEQGGLVEPGRRTVTTRRPQAIRQVSLPSEFN